LIIWPELDVIRIYQKLSVITVTRGYRRKSDYGTGVAFAYKSTDPSRLNTRPGLGVVATLGARNE
jgi:hypothetical protein